MKQKSQTKRHIRIIMLVAVFAVILFVIYGINSLFGLHLNSVALMFLMIMSIFLAAIMHAVYSLGFWRGLAIIGLGGLLGHLFEVLGLEHGTFFGGAYEYEPGYFSIAGVPYFVTVCWGIFVYTSYSVTNAFMRWVGKELPSIKVKQSHFWQIGPLIVMDGVLTTILDLALDPVQIQQGTWIWLEGGQYFGVPLGNFLGWFIVATTVSFIFRSFEYFYPPKHKTDPQLLLTSVINYGIFMSSLLVLSLVFGMFLLSSIIFTLISLVVLTNLAMFQHWRGQSGYRKRYSLAYLVQILVFYRRL